MKRDRGARKGESREKISMALEKGDQQAVHRYRKKQESSTLALRDGRIASKSGRMKHAESLAVFPSTQKATLKNHRRQTEQSEEGRGHRVARMDWGAWQVQGGSMRSETIATTFWHFTIGTGNRKKKKGGILKVFEKRRSERKQKGPLVSERGKT